MKLLSFVVWQVIWNNLFEVGFTGLYRESGILNDSLPFVKWKTLFCKSTIVLRVWRIPAPIIPLKKKTGGIYKLCTMIYFWVEKRNVNSRCSSEFTTCTRNFICLEIIGCSSFVLMTNLGSIVLMLAHVSTRNVNSPRFISFQRYVWKSWSYQLGFHSKNMFGTK